MIGILSGAVMSTSLGLIITRQVRMQGITVGHRDGLEAMMRAMSQHHIHPVVDKVFDFEALIESFDYIKSGQQFGKICISHG
jgi:NADPH:quinone reductase-like Zn-dependent oxidoreductase